MSEIKETTNNLQILEEKIPLLKLCLQFPAKQCQEIKVLNNTCTVSIYTSEKRYVLRVPK